LVYEASEVVLPVAVRRSKLYQAIFGRLPRITNYANFAQILIKVDGVDSVIIVTIHYGSSRNVVCDICNVAQG
jgi:hypothetical protein